MKRFWLFCCVVGLAFTAVGSLGAEESKKNKPAVFGTAESEDNRILRREAGAHDWQVVKQDGELYGGDTVLGLSGAVILSRNKAVKLTLLTDLNGRSPYPIIESVILLPTKPSPYDLEVTLDRGRIDLINNRDKGSAQVRVLVQGHALDLTLEAPKSRVALELFGRWPRGVPFTTTPGPKDVPFANLILLVLAGEVAVKHDKGQFAMSAPPGPAIVEWDNQTGLDASPQKLEMLPEWAGKPKPSPQTEKLNAFRKKLREAIASKPIGEVLDDFVNSEDPLERRIAVLAMGALDDLPRLAAALRNNKHADVWDNAVLALRHWIGRGPGQDMKLYNLLIESKKMTPVQAEIILSLLHSYGEEELARSDTYQLLIAYLDHDILGIRGLAHWHLTRMYPEGKEFGYDPLLPKEKRDLAVKKWKNVLKKGDLPPKPKNDK
jgi:hypothetical protein